ncbi:HAD-IIIA family hydrolase [Candidatus Sumerlaeota bacterium]|nr:HAD-IIIA family hydrolase [Candidatus Sumerlaeota bacterium]
MSPISDKFLPRDDVVRICRDLQARGRRIGFTSGAFDLIHAGHADFLERARALCDVLVVGVNTDDSVRQYKGSGRPVVPEDRRAHLVAALESVDYVFLFEERRNARNLELLKPQLYIKAGDYTESGLTSSEVVERHGGEAVILPIEIATSTTDLIRRACGSLSPDAAEKTGPSEDGQSAGEFCFDVRPAKTAPAVFLDRDGTINVETEYLHEPERLELLPGAGEGMRRFMDMGYRIVVVTNQAGIALGYFAKEDFYKTNRAMFRALKPFGVVIDRIYFCPHGLNDGCSCRKPGTALVERAREELNLDLAHSVFIGDRTSDLETGRRTGMTTILVRTGAAGSDGEYGVEPDYVASDLSDAARWVLERERTGAPFPEPVRGKRALTQRLVAKSIRKGKR